MEKKLFRYAERIADEKLSTNDRAMSIVCSAAEERQVRRVFISSGTTTISGVAYAG